MADKLTEVFVQDGERWNPIWFHSITEEQAQYKLESTGYKKKTITAVWKRANGLSVKTKETTKPNPESKATEGESKD